MKFSAPATTNPIDQMRVIGQPVDRLDGRLKTTGRAPYAYERHDVAARQAYGWVIGSAIPKGRILSMDLAAAKAAPGVLAIVTAQNAGKLGKGERNAAPLLGGPEVVHYHQAVAVVVAETFEQARHAANLVRVKYQRDKGAFDLSSLKDGAKLPDDSGGPGGDPPESKVGDFETAFSAAPVQHDATYRTAYESHSMMEPHATIAAWEGDQLHLWTSNQMIAWTVKDMAATLGMPAEKIHVSSPFIGGGFGGKLFLRSDILMAALAARAARRPVKVTLQRALIPNNTTHRAATIQRIRLGAGKDGRITAIAHESWSGNVEGGRPETAVLQTRALYSGAHRMTALRLARHDLPEANAMRAPGEAPGLAALEIAMDEMAEKLSIDPVEFRILNDTQTVPDSPPPPEPKNAASKAEKEKGEKKGKDSQSTPPPPANPPFSKRQLVECLREGAKRFDWEKRQALPGQVREGRWLIGLGMAVAFRDNMLMKSAARVRLEPGGQITVETDMTDIGTGSYTILAQTAAEMLGVPLEQVTVRLGDSKFPVSCGSGGQFGGNNSCAGVYAACVKLREAIAKKAGIAAADTALFAEGKVTDPATGKSLALTDAAGKAGLVGEDGIEYSPDLDKQHRQSTFGGHFVEVAVDSFTGEVRVRRMLAVCAAGRILNPKTARSQVIGAMTMGVGVALMEALHVDKKRGYFVNHDLAGYEVPVHADIPHQEVVFLEETDPLSSPMKAKGIAELGICGVAAAVSNAIYNATGIRVREYPLTLDKLLKELPSVA